MTGKPVLMIEVGSLGFGGGEIVGLKQYQDLRNTLAEWLKKEKEPIYLGGYRVRSFRLLICEQFDNLHCTSRDEILVRL